MNAKAILIFREQLLKQLQNTFLLLFSGIVLMLFHSGLKKCLDATKQQLLWFKNERALIKPSDERVCVCVYVCIHALNVCMCVVFFFSV